MALYNALHSKEITTAQIRALTFGFFSASEVRDLLTCWFADLLTC